MAAENRDRRERPPIPRTSELEGPEGVVVLVRVSMASTPVRPFSTVAIRDPGPFLSGAGTSLLPI
ncbi:MAG: hypothetical protein ACQETZ_11210 [Candidatus Fermentibacterota bacterium]